MLLEDAEETELPLDVSGEDDGEARAPVKVCPEKVRSRGCKGISERESRVTVMFNGVVHGTQSRYGNQPASA